MDKSYIIHLEMKCYYHLYVIEKIELNHFFKLVIKNVYKGCII